MTKIKMKIPKELKKLLKEAIKEEYKYYFFKKRLELARLELVKNNDFWFEDACEINSEWLINNE
jgi:hypothetical protein